MRLTVHFLLRFWVLLINSKSLLDLYFNFIPIWAYGYSFPSIRILPRFYYPGDTYRSKLVFLSLEFFISAYRSTIWNIIERILPFARIIVKHVIKEVFLITYASIPRHMVKNRYIQRGSKILVKFFWKNIFFSNSAK